MATPQDLLECLRQLACCFERVGDLAQELQECKARYLELEYLEAALNEVQKKELDQLMRRLERREKSDKPEFLNFIGSNAN